MNASCQCDVLYAKALIERTRLSGNGSAGQRWLPDGFVVDLALRPALSVVTVILVRPGRRIAPPPQPPQGMDSNVPSLFPVYPTNQHQAHQHQQPTVVLRLEASFLSDYPQSEARWRILEPGPHEVSFRPSAVADMASAMQTRSSAVDASRLNTGSTSSATEGSTVACAAATDALSSGRRGGPFLRDLLMYVDWWSHLFVDEQNTAAGSSTLWHGDVERRTAAPFLGPPFRASEVLSDSETGSLVLPLAAGQRSAGEAARGVARASSALFQATFSAGGNIIVWNVPVSAIPPIRRTQSSATIPAGFSARSQRLVNVDPSVGDNGEISDPAHRLPRSRRCHTMDDIAVTSGSGSGRTPPGIAMQPGPTSPVLAFVGRSFSATVLQASTSSPSPSPDALQSGNRSGTLHRDDLVSQTLPRTIPLTPRTACVFATALPVSVFMALPIQNVSSPRRAVTQLSATLMSERQHLPDAWKAVDVCVPLLAGLAALLPDDCGSSQQRPMSDLACVGLWHTLISPALRAIVRHLISCRAPLLAGAVVTCTLLPMLSWSNHHEAATLCTAVVALLPPLVVSSLVNALLHLCEVVVSMPARAAAVRHVAEWIAVRVNQGSLWTWDHRASPLLCIQPFLAARPSLGADQPAKDLFHSSHLPLAECAVCGRRLRKQAALPGIPTAIFKAPRGDIVLQCVLCGHGGHYDHVAEWWAAGGPHRLCPEGCGCACSY